MGQCVSQTGVLMMGQCHRREWKGGMCVCVCGGGGEGGQWGVKILSTPVSNFSLPAVSRPASDVFLSTASCTNYCGQKEKERPWRNSVSDRNHIQAKITG